MVSVNVLVDQFVSCDIIQDFIIMLILKILSYLLCIYRRYYYVVLVMTNNLSVYDSSNPQPMPNNNPILTSYRECHSKEG